MDGVTYDNICELRSQASGVRVDYRGECDDDSDTSVDDVCRRVRASGRCAFNADNCDYLVRPEDGCCPVCGELCHRRAVLCDILLVYYITLCHNYSSTDAA